jgi:hypothetical protein
MRHSTILLMSLLLLAIPTQVGAQDDEEPGPGDNFDLTGALDAFSQAKSLDEFEKKINDPDAQINNLDLNGDDEVDYVRVVEEVEGQTHIFILRVPLGENEEQDIATIDLEKTGAESVTAQIVGDEEIYGPDYIIEPDTSENAFFELRGKPVLLASASDDWMDFVPDELRGDDLGDPFQLALVIVFRWPIVPVVFAVGYSPWVSPYYWGYWPPYWHVWRPVVWSAWRVHRVHHAAHWHRAHHRASHHARNMHRAHHRSSSLARHNRPGGGDRPSTSDRQAGSGGDRQAATSRDRQGASAGQRPSTGSRDQAAAGSRDRSASSSRSREATSRPSSGQTSRSRSNSSFGGYSSSGSARSQSSRGSTSRGGGSRGGGSRGGGGRGGGGRR